MEEIQKKNAAETALHDSSEENCAFTAPQLTAHIQPCVKYELNRNRAQFRTAVTNISKKESERERGNPQRRAT